MANQRCADAAPNGKLSFMQNRFGFKYSIPPRMTHVLGPAIDAGEGNADARAHRRAYITRELIAKLPPAAIYLQMSARGY